MATPSNTIMIANYNKAITALTAKAARQHKAVEETEAQIEGFKALVAQLEAKR